MMTEKRDREKPKPTRQVTEIVVFYDRDRWRWQTADLDGQIVSSGIGSTLPANGVTAAVREFAIAIAEEHGIHLEPEDFGAISDEGGVCVWSAGDDESSSGWCAVAEDMPEELSNDYRRAPIRVDPMDAKADAERMGLPRVVWIDVDGMIGEEPDGDTQQWDVDLEDFDQGPNLYD